MEFREYFERDVGQTQTSTITTLQLNLTKLCNQTCRHCHVDAGPRRKEAASKDTLLEVIDAIKQHPSITTMDITGGAPELHPDFTWFVESLRPFIKKIIIRHNLTVTLDPHPVTGESMDYLPNFFREHRVEVISSLPCYSADRTDKQRGDGVFEKSIESLRRLNRCGYGREDTLQLHLVYNPTGPSLPPDQKQLERDYKEILFKEYGIEFHRLLAMANVPIHRFRASLVQTKQLEAYQNLLREHYQPSNAPHVMCRSLLSIGYDGKLYACDFNQMLGWSQDTKIADYLARPQPIRFGEHCFACTAGQGTSCSGSLKNQTGSVENRI